MRDCLSFSAVVLLFMGCLISQPILAEDMSFVPAWTGGNCSSCSWVAAEGEITEDTPEQFRKFLKEHDYVQYIALNSPGGNLLGGVELGQIFRAIGAHVSVADTFDGEGEYSKYQGQRSGICASACVYAFMGGVERSLFGESFLGAHQFFSMGDASISSGDTQSLVGTLLLYALKMGVDPAVIVESSTTRPDGIYVFSPQELLEFGLVTEGRFQEPWRLEPKGIGLVLSTVVWDGATRPVELKLNCVERAGYFVVSISEDLERFEEARIGEISDQLGGPHPRHRLQLGDEWFVVTENELALQSVHNGFASIAFKLSTDHLLAVPQGRFKFDPGFARALWPLLALEADLPPANWLSLAARNCSRWP